MCQEGAGFNISSPTEIEDSENHMYFPFEGSLHIQMKDWFLE